MEYIGFISDAHGNPFGLQSCINTLREKNASKIYFLGDVAGYLPLVKEALKILKREEVVSIMGNHDAMICGLMDIEQDKSNIYGFGQLAKDVVSSVCSEVVNWPRRMEVDIHGRKLLLIHGSPWDELNEYIYRDGDLIRFGALEYDGVFMGHTHYPFSENYGDMLLVNAGSCGLPRDIGNLASCVLYDPGKNTAEVLRTEFDVDNLMRESGRVFTVPIEVKDCLQRRKT